MHASLIRIGLVSVTFRDLDPFQIIDLSSQAGIQGIEWGSDVHLPAGDFELARKIRSYSQKKGVDTFSYASYYKAKKQEAHVFDLILKTALELGVNRIRVWAGEKNSEDFSELEFNELINDLKRISQLSQNEGISIGVEFHGWTYTNTVGSTMRLFQTLEDPFIYSYWQPSIGESAAENRNALERLHQWVKMIHCFHWKIEKEQYVRDPLIEGKEDWKSYLHLMKKHDLIDTISLEFLRNDSIEQLLRDYTNLREWINELS